MAVVGFTIGKAQNRRGGGDSLENVCYYSLSVPSTFLLLGSCGRRFNAPQAQLVLYQVEMTFCNFPLFLSLLMNQRKAQFFRAQSHSFFPSLFVCFFPSFILPYIHLSSFLSLFTLFVSHSHTENISVTVTSQDSCLRSTLFDSRARRYFVVFHILPSRPPIRSLKIGHDHVLLHSIVPIMYNHPIYFIRHFKTSVFEMRYKIIRQTFNESSLCHSDVKCNRHSVQQS